MTKELQNVWLGVDVAKASKPIVEAITQNIEEVFANQWIEVKVKRDPHMTFGYFQTIRQEDLAKVLWAIHDLKEKHTDTQLVNTALDFDQTMHKLELWESNVNDQLYIVLRPHNPSPVFSEFIQQENISPHISLAKVSGSKDQIEELLSEIKTYRDTLIHDSSITVDLSKVHISF